MNKKGLRILIVILIVAGAWYFWGRNRHAVAPGAVQGGGAKVEEGTSSSQPSPLSREGAAAGHARVHYFTKEALAACATQTVALELTADPKYGHRAAGALVAMTLPLPADQAAQYVSALPSDTRLLSMRIDKEGVAHADYNRALDADAAPCVKTERRAQIEATLLEFPEVKGVVITVEGKVWE